VNLSLGKDTSHEELGEHSIRPGSYADTAGSI
jgi:hypothetical protein